MSSTELYTEAEELNDAQRVKGIACNEACVALKVARANGEETPELEASARLSTDEWETSKALLVAKARAAGKLRKVEVAAAAAAQSTIACDAMDAAIRPAGDSPGHYWHRGDHANYLCFAETPPVGVPRNEPALAGYVAHAAKLGATMDDYAVALAATLGRVTIGDDGRPTWERDLEPMKALKSGG